MYELGIIVALLVLGYFFGSLAERRHYASIRAREEQMLHLPTIMLKRPIDPDGVSDYQLVQGSAVISIDYFKKFVAALINLFGGRVTSYETIVDRARREAVLRMKEEAIGASEVINMRIETSSISKNAQQSIGAVEVLAYGTAVYR